MLGPSIARFLLTGVSVLIVSAFLPGMKARTYGDALWFAFMVAVCGAVLGFFLFPVALLGWALFGRVATFFGGGIVFLVAQRFSKGIEFSGCLMASVAALLVTTLTEVMVSLIFHA
jgi:uncharacterized membrane protein YvlD (DUF360 family)